MTFALPEPLAVLELPMRDGSVIVARRHGTPGGPRLYLSHGNGFAIDAYYPFWRHFLDRYELIVFDFRNSGWNPPSDPARHTYAAMAGDIEDVVAGIDARLSPRPAVGLFHSMSGRTAMKQAVEGRWLWAGLVLFDPPNLPPPGHPARAPMEALETRLIAYAHARRTVFADPAELAAEIAAARANRGWVEGAHALMARSVLRQDRATGQWRLVCPTALEAEIYNAAMALEMWPTRADFGGPVLLVGADPDAPYPSPTAPANRDLAREGGIDYVAIAGAGHMLQLEAPHACATAVEAFMARIGFAPPP